MRGIETHSSVVVQNWHAVRSWCRAVTATAVCDMYPVALPPPRALPSSWGVGRLLGGGLGHYPYSTDRSPPPAWVWGPGADSGTTAAFVLASRACAARLTGRTSTRPAPRTSDDGRAAGGQGRCSPASLALGIAWASTMERGPALASGPPAPAGHGEAGCPATRRVASATIGSPVEYTYVQYRTLHVLYIRCRCARRRRAVRAAPPPPPRHRCRSSARVRPPRAAFGVQA